MPLIGMHNVTYFFDHVRDGSGRLFCSGARDSRTYFYDFGILYKVRHSCPYPRVKSEHFPWQRFCASLCGDKITPQDGGRKNDPSTGHPPLQPVHEMRLHGKNIVKIVKNDIKPNVARTSDGVRTQWGRERLTTAGDLHGVPP